MTRKHIDCRAYPSASHCTVALSADSEDELVEAAAQHAVAVHGHQDGPELRAQLRSMIQEGEAHENLGQGQVEGGSLGHEGTMRHSPVGAPDDPSWRH
jgi:predicted small metal-binding protein